MKNIYFKFTEIKDNGCKKLNEEIQKLANLFRP